MHAEQNKGMTRSKRIMLGIVLACTLFGLAVWQFASAPATQSGDPVIEMTAENFKFTPAEVRVRAGAKVTLKVRSLDDKHGIAFKFVPEGQPEGSPAGLQFNSATPDWVLEKGQEQTIQFTAMRPGRYEFACSVFCGMGHNAMIGRIVVE